MDLYSQMAVKIIAGQETIIGPVAVEQAQAVKGLKVSWSDHQVAINGNKAKVIEDLVGKYAEIFGQISVEVSKHSIASLARQLPTEALPEILK